MKKFAFGLVVLVLATVATAQEKISGNISILEFNLVNTRFEYPVNQGLVTGQDNELRGLSSLVRFKLNDRITVGYRFERSNVSKELDVTQAPVPDMYTRIENPRKISGVFQYHEIFGSIKLGHTKGHRFLFGLARTTFDREWRWHERPGGIGSTSSEISDLGLMLGIEGQRTQKSVSFNYAGRFYPHSIRGETNTGQALSDISSLGFELSGSVTYHANEHVGVIGGYRYHQIRSEQTGGLLHITDKGLTVGIRLAF